MKNPVFKINESGEWFYKNSLISRKSLVKLFSKILIRHNDGTFHLKTPVEDVEILVLDVPFNIIGSTVIIECKQKIILETNVGDFLELGKKHPLWIEKKRSSKDLVPYVLVRPGIAAKVSRAVYYDLVSNIVEKNINGSISNVLESNGCFFTFDKISNREDFIGL